METGELDFYEMREAFRQRYEQADSKRRFLLRMYVLYSYNDMFYRYANELAPVSPTEEDRAFFEENCRELIRMEQTDDTLKAELMRESGDFQGCVDFLERLGPADEYELKVREKIDDRACINDSTVFEIKT